MNPYSYPGLTETPEMLQAMAREKYITPEQVLESVSKFTFFSTAEIKSDWRKAEVVHARSLCYLLMADYCFMSGRKIADYFDKERTVVDRALRIIRADSKDNSRLKTDISKCIEILFSVYRVS